MNIISSCQYIDKLGNATEIVIRFDQNGEEVLKTAVLLNLECFPFYFYCEKMLIAVNMEMLELADLAILDDMPLLVTI